MVRAGLRLDMQNSSQERRRNSAPPPSKPRGGPSALAGGEEQAGQARRPSSPHTLCLRGKSSANCAMVLLALPPADHLLIERDRGQFVPSRRRRMMANVSAEGLLKIPAEPSSELRIPNAAAQTRMVSVARIRLVSRKSPRLFKGIICDDISEFESHMPSHAVRSLWGMSGRRMATSLKSGMLTKAKFVACGKRRQGR